MSRNLLFLPFAIVASICTSLEAAYVEPGIGYTNAFSTQPPGTDWSTRTLGTTSAANAITTAAGLDAVIQTNTAAGIYTQCTSSTGNPPNSGNTATWSSTGLYLQTRPSGNAATLLMAMFMNNTGSNANLVRISYDFVTNRAPLVAEEVRGQRVYYSLSGTANTWSNIAELSQTAQGRLSVDLALPAPWTNGTRLYLLWADDNGSSVGNDDANDIDNFYIAVVGSVILTPSCTLPTPADGASFGAPADVTLTAAAYPGGDATILGVGFYEANGNFLGSDATAPYTIIATNLGQDTYQFFAIATNSLGATLLSPTNTVTVTNTPLSVTLVSPAHGQAFGSPAVVAYAAVAIPGTDGPATRSVAFYMTNRGSNTLLFTDNAPPYSNQVAGLGDGSYGFFAVVTNLSNNFAFSTTNVITVSSLVSGTVTRGPYLGSRGETNITVRWRTTETSLGRVRYGTTPSSLTNYADDTTSRTDHVVTLTGLMPETRYFYSIGIPAGTIQASTNYYFITAPPLGAARPTRMWFTSDYGQADTTQAAVRDMYLSYIATNGKAADLWCTGGDNEQSGFTGVDATYQTTVFNSYSNIFTHTPFFPCPGNHDGGASSAYWSIFDLPSQGQAGGYPSGNAHYYSFDYGNIHFISLDPFNTATDLASPMLAWLTNDLAHTTQSWIIAYWHAPVYCKVFYDSDTLSQSVAMRQNFVPLLEAAGVDLVLNGHSHVLQRTMLLNGHYGVASTLNATNILDGANGRSDGSGAYVKTNRVGTVYAVAPTGCGSTRSGTTTHPACLYTLNNTAGSIIIDVNTNRLDFKMLSSTGALADYFTIIKPASQVMSPILVAGPQAANGVFSATYQGTVGATYIIQSKDSLDAAWQDRANVVVPASGLILLEDSASAPHRFFQLIAR